MEHASIGIIGGADGPTQVFVATAMISPTEIFLGAVIIAVCVSAVIWLCKSKEK